MKKNKEDKSDSHNGNQFTQGQVYQIMKLIQETKNDSEHKVNNFVNNTSNENTVKGKKNKNSWVLDTGATDHVNFSIHITLLLFAEHSLFVSVYQMVRMS